MDELTEFLKKYIAFFQEMEKKQQEKLESLLKGSLEDIEATIAMQQAMDKQLQNMELKRTELFQKLGYEGRTFKELIAGETGRRKQELQEMYRSLENSIGNIKYTNQKCVQLAKTELGKLGAVPESKTNGSGQGYRTAGTAGGSILERKI